MDHGLVLGGVGLDLGAIQRHLPKAHLPRLLAKPQCLHVAECFRVEVQSRLGNEVQMAKDKNPAVVRLWAQGSLEVTQKPVAEQLLASPGAPAFP